MLYVTLRMFHILSGIFWGGSILFLVVVLFPALRRAKIPVFPVRRAIPAIILPASMASLLVLLSTGVAMTVILKGGSLSTLLTNKWGWAIVIAFVTTLVTIIGGLLLWPSGMRMAELDRTSRERPLTPDETRELNRCAKRYFGSVGTIGYYTVVFISIASMLILRYL